MAGGVATIGIKAIDGNGFINGKNAAGITIFGTSSDTIAGGLVGQTVTLTLNGKTYTATIAANGTWSLAVSAADLAALADGQTYTVAASATDKAGNPASVTSSVTVDKTASVSIDAIDGNNFINASDAAAGITVTGNTLDSIPADLDGQTLKLTLNGKTYTGTIQSDGTWSINIGAADLAALTNGKAYAAVAIITDLAGNVVSSTDTVKVDETASLAIKPIDGNGFINGKNAANGITIMGTSTGGIGGGDFAGQTLTLTLNGKTYTATIAANGTWSLAVSAADLAALADGQTYTVAASATDKAGNPASVTSSVTVDKTASVSIDAIDGNNFINASDAAAGITVTGNTLDSIPADLDGQTLKLTLNGKTYTGTIQSDGTWSINIGAADLAALTNGKAYAAVAIITDLAGNVVSSTDTVKVDETASLAIKPIDGNGFINGKNAANGITIMGTSTGGIGGGDFAGQTL